MSISGIARTLALALHVHAQLAQVTPEMVPLAVSPPMMLAPAVFTVVAVPAVNVLFECTALAAVDGKSFLTVRPVVALPIVAVGFARTGGLAGCGGARNPGLSTPPAPPRGRAPG